MMSVLVTGASTPIGERLVRQLLGDTRVKHVLGVGHQSAEVGLPFGNSKRFTYQQVDLRSARKVRDLLFGLAKDLRVDVVVHLSQHRSAHDSGDSVRRINVESTRSILELADRHPTIRRVVLRSFAEVYQVGLELPVLVTEDHPLNLGRSAPQYVRDRVEADLTACAQMGLIDAEIVVLRTAEALAPGTGSQLYHFLDSPFCLRPAGFDPMLNVASVDDIVQAVTLATLGSGEGVFNIPGADTLPLSECVRKWGTPCLPLPGELIRPMYRFWHLASGSGFRYGLNRKRMHYGLVLDGTRAKETLGYEPKTPVVWPHG